MTVQRLAELVREYKEFKLLADEATANADSIADELKAHMNAEGKDEITVDVFKVRYKEVTSNRVDTTTLKKELPEIAERYTKATTSRRFAVT